MIEAEIACVALSERRAARCLSPRLARGASLSRSGAERARGFKVGGRGRLYLAGGFDGSFLSELEIFDPAWNEWSSGPPMLQRRGGQRNASIASFEVALAPKSFTPIAIHMKIMLSS